MTIKEIVQNNIDKVEKAYPNLRFSDRWEWNHKVAYLSYLETKLVGQKHNNNGIISEDTIGIAQSPIEKPFGTHIPMLFEAVDLVRGSDGALQWLSFGLVNQTFVVPTISDISLIEPTNPNPEPPAHICPPFVMPGYEDLGGDALARQVIGVPLEADYIEAKQSMNGGSVVWTNRTIYDALAFILVDKMNPFDAYTKSAEKRRPEWRKALRLPN